MKITTLDNLWLEFRSAGRLLPWLGPALRGVLLRRLKDEACRQPEAQQGTVWKYCRGCPFMGDCAYGDLFEPDHLDWATNKLEPELVKLLNGRHEPPRPVILVPAYPATDEAEPGMTLPISLRFLSHKAAAHVDWVLDRLDQVGREGWLGKDDIRFRVDFREARESAVELTSEMLPTTIDTKSGVIPRLGIGLIAPLFLEASKKSVPASSTRRRSSRRDAASEPHLVVPTFEELFRASLDAVRAHLTAAGEPPPRLDLRTWGRAARGVVLLDHCFEEFTQPHTQSRHGDEAVDSLDRTGRRGRQSRGGQPDGLRRTASKDAAWGHREFHGTFGGGVYANVPWSFLPWLSWAGLLHVGEERVSGAGGWRVLLNP
ncbi:MAG: hypothetical protein ACKV2Q_32920 [Planctomycetaceae bacterium]